MAVSFEVYHLNDPGIDEVQAFWIKQWNQNFQKLIGKFADPSIFQKSDTYYILRFNGKIGAIMSSKAQVWSEELKSEFYYSAWPDSVDYLKDKGISNFHRMGMIAADPDLIPRKFKMTRVLIGCGLKYNFASNPGNQATVSFPRPDTSVYQACVDWGAIPIQRDLVMFNAPVNFTVLEKFNLRTYHSSPEVNQQTLDLWNDFCDRSSRRVTQKDVLPTEILYGNVPHHARAS
ncbi:MAG: hypothetical protein LW875_05620 [Proteobacteria bacterium]|jgi:hypothetical protein|nr:hypothetical protein [Pseudomonadota bacterium]